jgi:hypothetical protein
MSSDKTSIGSKSDFDADLIEFKDSEDRTTGSYAWGVIDEGIKAKVNIPNAFDKYYKDINESKKSLIKSIYLSSSHRNTIEVLPEFSSKYISNVSKIEYLLSPNSLEIISEKPEDAKKYRHDLSVSSNSLFTDTKNGGLKVDLSRALDSDFSNTLEGKYLFNQTIPDSNGAGSKTVKSAKWDVLADYYNHYKKVNFSSSTYKPSISPDDTIKDSSGNMRKFLPEKEFTNVSTLDGSLLDGSGNRFDPDFHPIAPVITQVIFRVKLNAMRNWGGGVQNTASQNFHHLNFEIVPQFVLWNPYNMTLSSSNYRVHFDPGFSFTIEYSKPEWSPKNRYNFRGSASASSPTNNSIAPSTGSNPERADFYAFFKDSGYLKGFRSFAHYLTNVSLEPGEVKSFGLVDQDTTGTARVHNSQTGWYYGLTSSGQSKVFLFPQDYNDGTFSTNNLANDFGIRGCSMIPTSFISSSGNNMYDGADPWNKKVRIHGLNLYSSDFNEIDDPVAFRMIGRFYLSVLDSNDTSTIENVSTAYTHNADTEPDASLGTVVRLGSSFMYNEGDQSFNYPARTDDLTAGITETWTWDANQKFFPLSIFMNLKTTNGQNGNLPIYGQFNPLAWHFTPSTSSNPSDMWHVDYKNFDDWNNPAWNQPASLTGFARWGSDTDLPGMSTNIAKEIPIRPLQSVSEFMHAEIGFFDTAPLYTIGNSYAPPYSNSASSSTALTSIVYTSGNDVDRFNNEVNTADWSWLYNNSIYDGYFFSTIPNNGNTNYPPFKDLSLSDINTLNYVLPNSRYKFFKSSSESQYLDDLFDAKKTASKMYINGGFNINSTSVNAWKLLLSSVGTNNSLNSVDINSYYDAINRADETLNSSGNLFSRFSNPMGAIANNQDTEDPKNWTGIRELSSSQIENLAVAIVDQVKQRGPFQSISDFVNRRLEASPLGEKGALQAAIDNTINNPSTMGSNSNIAQLWGDANDTGNLLSKTGIGTNSWLLQNDILRAINPVISARSDTFTIRSYGDTKDPNTGETKSRIVCEAVVQRIPRYIDNSQNPHEDNLNTINKKFGRKFQIVDIRWIPIQDI